MSAEQFSYVFISGDYDRDSLPDAETIADTWRTRDEAEADLTIHIRNAPAALRLTRDEYVIVRREVTAWEVAS